MGGVGGIFSIFGICCKMYCLHLIGNNNINIRCMKSMKMKWSWLVGWLVVNIVKGFFPSSQNFLVLPPTIKNLSAFLILSVRPVAFSQRIRDIIAIYLYLQLLFKERKLFLRFVYDFEIFCARSLMMMIFC